MVLPVSGDVKLDETNFPDSVFREYLKTNYDKDKNNSLSQDEILAIHEIETRVQWCYQFKRH